MNIYELSQMQLNEIQRKLYISAECVNDLFIIIERILEYCPKEIVENIVKEAWKVSDKYNGINNGQLQ